MFFVAVIVVVVVYCWCLLFFRGEREIDDLFRSYRKVSHFVLINVEHVLSCVSHFGLHSIMMKMKEKKKKRISGSVSEWLSFRK